MLYKIYNLETIYKYYKNICETIFKTISNVMKCCHLQFLGKIINIKEVIFFVQLNIF